MFLTHLSIFVVFSYSELLINNGGFDFSGLNANSIYPNTGIGSVAPNSVQNATQIRNHGN